jgi:hypothetical protein
MSDVKSATKLVKKMYNLRLRQHEVPTHHVLKMLAYYAKQEVCLPDPVRVPLNKFKRDETDSAFTKFRRLVFGMVVVSAGQACPRRGRAKRPIEPWPARTSCCARRLSEWPPMVTALTHATSSDSGE